MKIGDVLAMARLKKRFPKQFIDFPKQNAFVSQSSNMKSKFDCFEMQ